MSETSFLPAGEKTLCHALAWVAYSREDFMKIADGAEPASFRQDDRAPLWGLLYLSDESLGFFVHPAASTILGGLSLGGCEPSPAIHLRVPLAAVIGAESVGIREPRTRLGKFLSSSFLKSESQFELSWKKEGSREDGECFVRFFVERDALELKRAVEGKLKASPKRKAR
jgi:hypothetical protein